MSAFLENMDKNYKMPWWMHVGSYLSLIFLVAPAFWILFFVTAGGSCAAFGVELQVSGFSLWVVGMQGMFLSGGILGVLLLTGNRIAYDYAVLFSLLSLIFGYFLFNSEEGVRTEGASDNYATSMIVLSIVMIYTYRNRNIRINLRVSSC